jgi:HK97 family phage major capsid protein
MEEILTKMTGELLKVKTDIDGMVNKANAEIKNDVAAMREETKSELKNATDKFNELDKKRQEDFDSMQANLAKLASNQNAGRKAKSVEQLILKTFGENFEKIKSLPTSDSRNLNLEIKAAPVMTPQDNWTGEVAPPDRNNEIIYDPRTDQIPASALIRNFTATGNLVKYIQETSLENYTAVVAAGATKPRSGTELETKQKNIIKLATEMTFAEEMLEDFAQYGPYISATLQDLLQEERNEKILYGAGGTSDVEGLTVMASAFVGGAYGVNGTMWDVLIQAITQIRKKRYSPTFILLNPQDVSELISQKDSEGAYHFGAFLFGTQQLNVMGVPIISHNTLTAGDFLVGTATGASLWNRMAVNVRFYDQHAENATKNLITAVCETRLAITPERPSAFVYGDFASALAANSGT